MLFRSLVLVITVYFRFEPSVRVTMISFFEGAVHLPLNPTPASTGPGSFMLMVPFSRSSITDHIRAPFISLVPSGR